VTTDEVGCRGVDAVPRLRPAVRALVVDPAERVLLVRFEFDDVGTVWAPPGGGIEPGEERLEALRRELAEEVGLLEPEIGPCLWIRTHLFALSNRWDGQRDHVHLVRSPPGWEPAPGMSWAQLNAEHVMELRWWTLEELTSSGRATRFAPQGLADLVLHVFRHGPPAEPFDVTYRS
jgi:8-oxo-dGTP diphosphatase